MVQNVVSVAPTSLSAEARKRRGLPLFEKEKVEQILREVEQAGTAREVAERYGVSLQWIYRQRVQAKRRRHGVRLVPKVEEAVVEIAVDRDEVRKLRELVGKLTVENSDLREQLVLRADRRDGGVK